MSHNVSRLKELLFDSEHATLSELHRRLDQVAAGSAQGQAALARDVAGLTEREARARLDIAQRLDQLFERTGTEEKLRASVAGVLDGALRDAEVARHDAMARAVAPLVVRTIKTELRNSQDEMVEALYPITGRLVKSYVASAMKDLMDQINRKLENGLLKNPLMLRLRSITSGRSMAELALAETQRVEVEELFLIRRGSGELVRHWPEQQPVSSGDAHLSSVLTAINEFATATFKEEGGTLRNFEVDDYTVYLRPSPLYLLAVRCHGTAAPSVEQVIDEVLIEVVGAHPEVLSAAPEPGDEDHAAATAQVLRDTAGRLETRIAAKHEEITEAAAPRNPLKTIAIVLAVPLLAWLGWLAYTSYLTAIVRDRALAIVAATPAMTGYPVQLEVTRGGRAARLLGLAPDIETKQGLIERLRTALPDTILGDQLGVLPAQADAGPSIARLRQSLASLAAETRRSEVRRALDRAGRQLEQSLPEIGGLAPLLRTDAERASARASGDSVASAIAELAEPRRALGQSGPADAAALDRLVAPLQRAVSQLNGASGRLSSLLGGPAGGRQPPALQAASNDPAEVADTVALAAERIATLSVAVAQALAVKPAPQAPPPPPLPARDATPLERLAAWTQTNALFFGNGTDYRPDVRADEIVAELARLMSGNDILVRVVGYTDERGGSQRNTPLAQQRAEKVVEALVDRGVARSRLVAVGRTSGHEISSSTGPQSPNRRVSFEVGFRGEAAAPQ